MFIAEIRTFGFQNVFAIAEKQCWALPQTGPQLHKSANCGLKVLVRGFAVKKLKSIANPQINNITGIVSAISKKNALFTIQCIEGFGWMYF